MPLHEELYQPLVAAALVRTFNLVPECLFAEVKTREGSICDLVYVFGRRVIGFELKIADDGEALVALDARAQRQLRHFRAACDALYLVTLASPRSLGLTSDGRVHIEEPVERQLLPEGVGWVVFDRLSLETSVLVPATDAGPVLADRLFVLDHIEGRLTRARRATTECRS